MSYIRRRGSSSDAGKNMVRYDMGGGGILVSTDGTKGTIPPLTPLSGIPPNYPDVLADR